MNATRKTGRKPAASRRTHRKSRLGCANCKKRRIKCDEQKPSCTNCARHAIRCDFASASSPVASNAPSPGYLLSPSAFTPLPTGSPASQTSSVISDSGLNLLELELLQNYIASTSYTLSGGPMILSLWQTTIPQIGFANPHVLQLILATSAFHLARHQPERQAYLRNIAEGYHNAALQKVTAILPHLDANNCDQLYLSAVLICVLSFARGPTPGDYLIISAQGMSEWLVLNRGTRSIIELQRDVLWSGKLSAMFRTAGQKLQVAFKESQVPEANEHIRTLRQFLVSTAVTEPNAGAYVKAFDRLIRSLHPLLEAKRSGDHSNSSMFVFSWIYCLEEDFILCLQQHQPLALVILSYFVVMVHGIGDDWFMEGWSDHLMIGICSLLPEEYKSWIRWPAEQIGWTI